MSSKLRNICTAWVELIQPLSQRWGELINQMIGQRSPFQFWHKNLLVWQVVRTWFPKSLFNSTRPTKSPPERCWLIISITTALFFFLFSFFFPGLYFPFSCCYPLLSTIRFASFPTQIGFLPGFLLLVVYPFYFLPCLCFYHLFYHGLLFPPCQWCSYTVFDLFFHFYVFAVLIPKTVGPAEEDKHKNTVFFLNLLKMIRKKGYIQIRNMNSLKQGHH